MKSGNNNGNLTEINYFNIAAGTSVGNHDPCVFDKLVHFTLLVKFLPDTVFWLVRGIAVLDDDFLIMLPGPIVHIFNQTVKLLLVRSDGNYYHAQKRLP